ncbi:histidine kinase/DNA gyrase B/HSP90-like ATPase [Rhodopseudomonas faecalis]|uniref:histidine kinase n=2 Tax=Rhodopseudomonas faecalis TaxID=99655 RepID=A0A318TEF7_9BRAD|nr:histidine kinase/DNA gyrase B/HSP90-like ATPase [Rhodopseudomonas faecalis]
MLTDITTISRMMDETLDYLRDDAQSETVTRIDLPSFLKTICFDLADMGHDVAYVGPGRLSYECRPRALSRAITNIVGNAVKFAGKVSVALAEDETGQIEIEIAENGPGIPESIRDRVFDPFFKADNARTSINKGFGLGLSIAREVVQRHGGAIELNSNDPTGLRVVMTMPAVGAVSSKSSKRQCA